MRDRGVHFVYSGTVEDNQDDQEKEDDRETAASSGAGISVGESGRCGRRRPGPVPGPPTKKYTVLLDEGLGEWGKRQPGGLSELVRRLLGEARGGAHDPPMK